MSDRGVVATAALVAFAGFVSLPVPMWLAAVALVAGLGVGAVASGRWAAVVPVAAACALALVATGRASSSERALGEPLPAMVDGIGRLVSDPELQLFGVTAIVSIDGRRYVATVDDDHAAVLSDLATGDHVVLRGRPAPLRGAPLGWVRSRHLAGRLAVSSIRAGPPASLPMRAANAVRSVVVAGSHSFSDVARPQYLGMVVGDDRGQDPVTEFRFRASGLTHLLVVSGQNVAFVLLVVSPVLRHLPRRSRAAATVAVIVLFVLVTRADPSVLRAATMAGIVVLSVASGRLAPAARVLALTVIALVVVDPLIVQSLGFQLSVAATAGLMVGVRQLAPRIRAPEPVAAALAATISAQIATAPLLLGISGWLSPSAPLTNLLASPGSAAVMMLGATVGVFAGLIDERFASVLQVPARLGVWSVESVASAGSQLPLAALTPLRTLWLLVWGAAALAVLSSSLVRRGRWCATAVVVAAIALVPGALGPGEHRVADGVVLVVGECGGTVVALDGAGDALATLEALWVHGVRSIAVVVVGPSRRDARVGEAVREQFGADRVVHPGDDPHLVDALVVTWSRTGQPAVSEPSCTVSR